ncbi:TlpA family protein disulfide reductase [Variovorax soli]|uniref:TlpA family protein disulfide reductase n=1 Tax=Variovorax soli TaxID=376815 RepID=UPI000838DA40|nr:TlpA disulfide reductase family protein [Variovorax soli]
MSDNPSAPNPSRRLWLYGAAAVLAAGAGAGAAWWKQRPAGGHEALGADFWSRKFERPEGGELALQALRGKPVLLNFWATWCAPCVEEMPMLDRFFREHAANGVQVVGLAIDQPSAVRKFLQRTPVTYPIGLAGLDGTELIRALGNTAGGLPFTLALTADGAVAERKMGKLEQVDLDTWRREFFHG